MITTDSKSFASALALVGGAVPAKSSMPMLHNVVLDTATGSGKLYATDLDMVAFVDLPGTVTERGRVCFPFREAKERVKALGAGAVEIGADGSDLKLTSGSFGATIAGMSFDDYPAVPVLDETKPAYVEVPASTMAAMLGFVDAAISKDETRLQLNALLVQRVGRGVRMVSTDGHRLTLLDCPMPSQACKDGDWSVLVSRNTVMQIKRICKAVAKGTGRGKKKADPTITLRVQGVNLSVQNCTSSVVAKMPDTQFPPYKYVIPRRHEASAIVDREALLQALRAVETAAGPKGSCKLTFKVDSLTIESQYQPAVVTIPCRYDETPKPAPMPLEAVEPEPVEAAEPEPEEAVEPEPVEAAEPEPEEAVEPEPVEAAEPEPEEAVEPEPVEAAEPGRVIGFNVRYLIDAVERVNGPDVFIGLSDALDPCVITDAVANLNGMSALHVVMPCRI